MQQEQSQWVKEYTNSTQQAQRINQQLRAGDFSNLDGSTVDDILDRIPGNATIRDLRPVAGGTTEGFEYKWYTGGRTYRVRVQRKTAVWEIYMDKTSGLITPQQFVEYSQGYQAEIDRIEDTRQNRH